LTFFGVILLKGKSQKEKVKGKKEKERGKREKKQQRWAERIGKGQNRK